MRLIPGSPFERTLTAALLIAPVLYLLVDSLYAIRGWDDGNVAALHLVAAVAYGLAALRLVAFADGRFQAVFVVVALLGVAGNVGVAINTLHLHYGHPDLFDLDGPANALKMVGFFFPLTLLLGAVAVRRSAPLWAAIAMAAGALLFPIAHVGNSCALAVVDAALLLAAFLGVLWSVSDEVALAT